jgi:hypothetical protein
MQLNQTVRKPMISKQKLKIFLIYIYIYIYI